MKNKEELLITLREFLIELSKNEIDESKQTIYVTDTIVFFDYLTKIINYDFIYRARESCDNVGNCFRHRSRLLWKWA